MRKNFFLEGENIGLSRIEEFDDLSNYHKWFNDPKVNEFNSHAKYPMTIIEIKKFLNSISEDTLHLSIFIKENNVHIGNLSLQSVDFINRTAELAIIMGEKNYWGKGYSFEACSLILKHGFEKLNLRRIYCGTSELNIGMQKLAIKLGMELEGRRKGEIFYLNRYVDLLEYGIVKDSDITKKIK